MCRRRAHPTTSSPLLAFFLIIRYRNFWLLISNITNVIFLFNLKRKSYRILRHYLFRNRCDHLNTHTHTDRHSTWKRWCGFLPQVLNIFIILRKYEFSTENNMGSSFLWWWRMFLCGAWGRYEPLFISSTEASGELERSNFLVFYLKCVWIDYYCCLLLCSVCVPA